MARRTGKNSTSEQENHNSSKVESSSATNQPEAESTPKIACESVQPPQIGTAKRASSPKHQEPKRVNQRPRSDSKKEDRPTPSSWTSDQVIQWLKGLNLGEDADSYCESFRAHHVSGAVLCELTESDLKQELGIKSLGHRKIMIQALRELGIGSLSPKDFEKLLHESIQASERLVTIYAETNRLLSQTAAAPSRHHLAPSTVAPAKASEPCGSAPCATVPVPSAPVPVPVPCANVPCATEPCANVPCATGSEGASCDSMAAASVEASIVALQERLNAIVPKLPLPVQMRLREFEECQCEVYERLRAECEKLSIGSGRFRRVPQDYYSRTLDERRAILNAANCSQLCKTMVVENTSWTPNASVDPKFNSRHYAIVIQYGTKFDPERLSKLFRGLSGLSKRSYHFRLANDKEMEELSGFEHNSVTPVGMKTALPIVLSQAITEVHPPFMWLGAGEVDLKLGMLVEEFLRVFNPVVGNIVHTGDKAMRQEELDD
eukprot:TRINITY_DN735_c0_g1::TRINITY_DN735_c0_g1_i1::g.18433::m.18433 TRINITY_DN735_c0_g1::TRINITY_DN735_c0_g1_i1::g.18433  ORF type:complete len:491 (+),score=97.73,SAM_2/PF07647.12/2.2e-15,SAM_2/PF07647.12/6e+03,SAM_1/PF00536.25/7.6e-15,tRNA_edit/PF04073.10/1.5e-07,Ste50p-SAM/PF09235.5/1.9e-05,SAM_PNT/PF02198.11/4.6e-05,SAM_PNT/PF02198.11/1.8e+03,Herpes_BLLF1/PF05109.8/0.18,Herpes_BLLF1/PF05109.8/38 TRINITY_DN735_c0_g1_i1:77-1549(+)